MATLWSRLSRTVSSNFIITYQRYNRLIGNIDNVRGQNVIAGIFEGAQQGFGGTAGAINQPDRQTTDRLQQILRFRSGVTNDAFITFPINRAVVGGSDITFRGWFKARTASTTQGAVKLQAFLLKRRAQAHDSAVAGDNDNTVTFESTPRTPNPVDQNVPLAAGQLFYVDIVLPVTDVTNQDLITVKLSRDGGNDSYTGELVLVMSVVTFD